MIINNEKDDIFKIIDDEIEKQEQEKPTLEIKVVDDDGDISVSAEMKIPL